MRLALKKVEQAQILAMEGSFPSRGVYIFSDESSSVCFVRQMDHLGSTDDSADENTTSVDPAF